MTIIFCFLAPKYKECYFGSPKTKCSNGNGNLIGKIAGSDVTQVSCLISCKIDPECKYVMFRIDPTNDNRVCPRYRSCDTYKDTNFRLTVYSKEGKCPGYLILHVYIQTLFSKNVQEKNLII